MVQLKQYSHSSVISYIILQSIAYWYNSFV